MVTYLTCVRDLNLWFLSDENEEENEKEEEGRMRRVWLTMMVVASLRAMLSHASSDQNS